MRAITLWQPWASAVALGLKRVETRSWKTPYRGPLAIHAAKCWRPIQREKFKATCIPIGNGLPFGSIVATCTMVACVAVEWCNPTEEERLWGDFSDGRYAFLLENIRPLKRPLPIERGSQTFFTVPDKLLESHRRRTP
jgi:hypothetical protein